MTKYEMIDSVIGKLCCTGLVIILILKSRRTKNET